MLQQQQWSRLRYVESEYVQEEEFYDSVEKLGDRKVNGHVIYFNIKTLDRTNFIRSAYLENLFSLEQMLNLKYQPSHHIRLINEDESEICLQHDTFKHRQTSLTNWNMIGDVFVDNIDDNIMKINEEESDSASRTKFSSVPWHMYVFE